METSTRTKEIVLIVVAVVLVAIGLVAWRVYYRYHRPPAPGAVQQPSTGAPIKSPDLGSQLYEQSKNPIQNKLPESVAPAPNPLKNIYKNPFQ